jgi:hypothetical protein
MVACTWKKNCMHNPNEERFAKIQTVLDYILNHVTLYQFAFDLFSQKNIEELSGSAGTGSRPAI